MQQDPYGPKVRKPAGCPVLFVFTIGTISAWFATGVYYMRAIDGAELHPDGPFMGAVCLLCPLVGLVAALLTWRLSRRV